MRNFSGKSCVIAVIGILLLTVGCGVSFTQPGPTETQEETVDLAGAERVNVEIQPALQELTLTGGATALFAGAFTYNLEELAPTVTYMVADGVGELMIGSAGERVTTIPVGQVVSEWDLQFNNAVPLALDLNLGLGNSDIDLHDLNLTALEIDAGAGRVRVDVGQQNLDQLRFNAGLGEVDVSLGGGRIDTLDFSAGAGNVTIDLTGDWQSDLNAQIDGALGEITLILPPAVGVRIVVDQGLGSVDASDLQEEADNVYVNEAYGNAAVTLEIDVNQAAGDINLRVAQ